MEWVETTAKTLAAAKEAALDQLGVAEDDAEFEILAEPKAGLFGFLRGEARVRARVRPTRPRPKVDRRDRRRRRGSEGRDRDRDTTADTPAGAAAGAAAAPGATAPDKAPRSGDRHRSRRRGGSSRSRSGDTLTRPEPEGTGPNEEDDDVGPELSPKEQADVVAEFLQGMLDAFGLEGALSQETVDEETLEVRIEGDDLGLLIGPRGQTLQAVQELGRAAVQRRLAGGREARIRVDVAGYRQRRREALERFARGVAEDVQASGVAKALEPMNPADRKVVHDTVNELDGVRTMSEGEEPNRRVVIVPAPAPGAAEAGRAEAGETTETETAVSPEPAGSAAVSAAAPTGDGGEDAASR